MRLETINNRGVSIKFNYVRSEFSRAYEDWKNDLENGVKRTVKEASILSKPDSNTKLAKQTERTAGYKLYSLFLAPAGSSGYNTCPWASDECVSLCLNEAGRGAMKSVQEARIKKTKMMVELPYDFMYNLLSEMRSAIKSADKNSHRLAIRLNGTSDIAWEYAAPFIQDFCSESDNKFIGTSRFSLYDYTKAFARIKNRPSWYDMTLSYSGHNWEACDIALKDKLARVAVVFHKKLPTKFRGYDVINGDLDDYRFMDEKGIIVGLIYKSVGSEKDQMVNTTNLNFVIKE